MSPSTQAGMAECQVAELGDGSLVINFRGNHENPCDCRAVATSHDGGATWSGLTWQPQLIEPVCSAGLLGVPIAGGTAPLGLLYFSNPATTSARVNMTLRISSDGGASWPLSDNVQLWLGPSAYSVLVPVGPPAAPTGVAVVFERGVTQPYEHVSVGVVSVATGERVR